MHVSAISSTATQCNLTPFTHFINATEGDGKFRATYNATKSGNYSLSIVDASDGEHVVGSPFDVIVEPAQPFAPATLVWWDRQVRLFAARGVGKGIL